MRHIICVCIIILIFTSVAIAWDDKTTHMDISRVAANNSILNIGFLPNTLGINNGLDTKLSWTVGNNTEKREIREWIEQGGKLEDSESRYLNHFQDITNRGVTNRGVSP